MLQTYEAVVDENGLVRLVEDAFLRPSQKVLVTVLETAPPVGRHPFGLAAGLFVVPDDFDEPYITPYQRKIDVSCVSCGLQSERLAPVE